MTNWYKTIRPAQSWRKLALAALLAGGATAAQAQGLDYGPSGSQNVAGTYTDLGTTGTVITTANNDNANSAVLPIGFSFSFNRTDFTDFVLNTNGFIKLGTTAPSATNITNFIAAPDLNIIAPLGGVDLAGALDQATAPTEFRVATTGTVGSRICTIQWENLADKTAQFATIQFQAKLYEGTNRIEFVYGTWTPGTATAIGINFMVGMKGSSAQPIDRLFAEKASSSTAWTTTFFSTISGTFIPAHFVRKTFLPDAGRTYRFNKVLCAPASNVAITTTTTTGQVTFSGASNATGYTLIYGPTGFDPATSGTTIAPATSPVTITGLTPSTLYQVYIRTTCSATEQSLAGPFPLSTLCPPPIITTFPYTQNFDNVNPGNTAPCGITVTDSNGDGNTWEAAAYTDGSVSTPNAMVYYYETATGGNDWFYTPALFMRAGSSYQLSFKYKTIADPNFPTFERLEVKYGTSATPAAQTNLLWKNENITNGSFVTTMAGTSSTQVMPITPTTNGNVYIGFHAFSDPDQYLIFVDDVTVASVVTGVSDALVRAVSVFPNPSAGEFTVDVRGANAKGAMQVEVTNLLGQRVHTATIRDNFENKLNLSALSNGMYTLKVKSGNDFMIRNIVVQK